MIKKLSLLFFYSINTFGESSAFSPQAYLERFQTFQTWYQQLPLVPNEAFLTFVDGTTPLSNALREKWLYELARIKDWPTYQRHYQASNDINLQCYALLANYYTGHPTQALEQSKTLWLTPYSLPQSCNGIIELLRKSPLFNDDLIRQRLTLALESRNLSLARFLLKQMKTASPNEDKLLTTIYQNPKRINLLQPSPLHETFYLYGLKRLVSINMNDAISYWQSHKTRQILSSPQQQAFLAHLALYKAMRNQTDTHHWFSQVKPAYFNEILLGWQIRHALKHHRWPQVIRLIQLSTEQKEPMWQYWLARAYAEQGESAKAHAIYQELAAKRHYYGFMASTRIHQKPNFAQEPSTNNHALLQPYRGVIQEIERLYKTGNPYQASRLIHHFISELPKDHQSALVGWLEQKLQWYAKSVYLSNRDILQNQLSLRFPLAYYPIVQAQAKLWQLPPEFIYAIIRQESVFRDDVVSPAGALGLMQVMPATARLIARMIKLSYQNNKQLFQEDKNIALGSAYLGDLAKRFHRHPILMAAAYNAGPRQVKSWVDNEPNQDIDIWIETLPWPETRNYVKNVVAYYMVYQYRLYHRADLSSILKPLNF